MDLLGSSTGPHPYWPHSSSTLNVAEPVPVDASVIRATREVSGRGHRRTERRSLHLCIPVVSLVLPGSFVDVPPKRPRPVEDDSVFGRRTPVRGEGILLHKGVAPSEVSGVSLRQIWHTCGRVGTVGVG